MDDLGEKAGFTRAAISLIENGSRSTSQAGRIAIAQAFGMSVEALLEYAARGAARG